MSPVRALGTFARNLATIFSLTFAATGVGGAAFILADASGVGFSLAGAYAIKFVVQEAVARNGEGALAAALALAAFGGASAIGFSFYLRFAPRIGERVSLHVDSELIRLTAKIPTLEYQDRPEYADKIALIRASRNQLGNSLNSIVLNLRTSFQLAGTLFILGTIDLRLVALLLFGIPRAIAGQRAQALTKQAQETTAEPGRLRGHIYAKASSAAAGKEIRIFGLDQELVRRFHVLTGVIRKAGDRANWEGTFWVVVGDVIFMAGCVGAIAWIVLRAAHREIGLGEVVLVITLASTLTGLMTTALQWSQVLQTTMQTVERFNWLKDFVAAAAGPPRSQTAMPKTLERGITVEGASFTYPDREKPVLSDISLTLPAGKVVALVGENGSGKSTLVKLLCGFYQPTRGRIAVDDVDLANLGVDDWRGRVSAAFQDFTSFELVLHESVGVGELKQLGQRDQVADALHRAGAAEMTDLKPSGLDTMLGKNWGGVELSGGQWQKLALGRAVFRDKPLLVVFDEPTAALDATAEHEMFERFAAEARSGAARGRVTLLVSHRFSTVRMADIIVVLDKGRIEEVGSHGALMARGGLYAELFELQARAYR